MKILTWNILASEWVKKKDYPTVKDYTLFKRGLRIRRILDKLKEESADIVFLQEVMPMEYRLLHQEFHRTYRLSELTPIRWGKKTSDSGNVTLVKRRHFISWSESSFDHGVYVQIDQVHLFNIHLDDVSYAKRKKQLGRLPLNDKTYVILGGDFNEPFKKESPLYQLPGFVIHNTCNSYFVEKNLDIDNILTKGLRPIQTTCEYLPKTVEEGLSIYGSDHIPVTATVY